MPHELRQPCDVTRANLIDGPVRVLQRMAALVEVVEHAPRATYVRLSAGRAVQHLELLGVSDRDWG
jgi:hypothetical protein